MNVWPDELWPRPSVRSVVDELLTRWPTPAVEAALEAHRLVAGEGFYGRSLVCDSCHVVPVDAVAHVERHLRGAQPPVEGSMSRVGQWDPRESQITPTNETRGA